MDGDAVKADETIVAQMLKESGGVLVQSMVNFLVACGRGDVSNSLMRAEKRDSLRVINIVAPELHSILGGIETRDCYLIFYELHEGGGRSNVKSARPQKAVDGDGCFVRNGDAARLWLATGFFVSVIVLPFSCCSTRANEPAYNWCQFQGWSLWERDGW